MEIQEKIDLAQSELAKVQSSWCESVARQLNYCAATLKGEVSGERLEGLNLGPVIARDFRTEIPGILRRLLPEIQEHMQQKFLPYSAKVRLGIHHFRDFHPAGTQH
jgi:hypothetical protein